MVTTSLATFTTLLLQHTCYLVATLGYLAVSLSLPQQAAVSGTREAHNPGDQI